MSRIGARSSDQWFQERRHKQAVERKYQKIQGLRALVEMWDTASPRLRSAEHADYLRKLRQRLRSAENQFKAMKP